MEAQPTLTQFILTLRHQRIMLDSDLAQLHQVSTKRLNEQVRRNPERFPPDFMFQLTKEEKLEVVANCDHLQRLKFSSTLPYAFTEHCAVMLASVLNSSIAVQASLQVVRAFVKLRQLVGQHQELALKLEALEAKYDGQFAVVFQPLRALMQEETTPLPPIGFIRERSS